MRHWLALLGSVGALLCVGCTVEPKSREPEPAPEADRRVSVLTDNYPVYYFASRIAGDLVDCAFPAPRDVDPAYWQPQRAVLQEYQDADLILLNGADYARWVKTASLPLDSVVETAAGFSGEFLQQPGGETHSHGPEGEHTHTGTDFNTWLDPTLAMKQADAVWEALIERLPGNDEALNQRVEALRSELRALDARLRSLSETLAGQPMLASHPVYNYLARRYGWNLSSVHWEPDEAPDEAAWDTFDAMLKEHPAKIMLWEDEPHPATAALLEERRVRVVVFRTCGNRPPVGDYMSEMQGNVERLASAAG